MTEERAEQLDVDTVEGAGCWYIGRARGSRRAQVLLGHGAGGGVDAPDLAALAQALPGQGIEVARFEQPWRRQGRKVATSPKRLDAAWLEAVPVVGATDVPLVVGGRSAGARVACRTAGELRARGVLALAFPLHPPGRPDRLRAAELPPCDALIVQGERDPFGTPAELARHVGPSHEVCGIPGADHSFRVLRSGAITGSEALELMIIAVVRWVDRLARGGGAPPVP